MADWGDFIEDEYLAAGLAVGRSIAYLGLFADRVSLGTFIRINYFFPDITPRETASPSLPEILSNPESLPLDAQAVRLSGQLLVDRVWVIGWDKI